MSGSRPWSLIIFTVLAQTAVGAFVAQIAFRLAARGRVGEEALEQVGAAALSTIGLVLAGGVLAASFHLARPGRAHRILANVGSSWLSREVVLGVAFGLVLVAYVAVQALGAGSLFLRDGLGVVAALVGVALVGAMSRIYMIRTVPAWNTTATPVSFFIAMMLLGALTFGAQLAVTEPDWRGVAERELVDATVEWIAVFGLVLAAATLIATALHGARLRRLGGAAAESFDIVFRDHLALLVLRAVLLVVGVVLFGAFAAWKAAWAALAGLVAALGGEVLGRFLFFASHRRTGL